METTIIDNKYAKIWVEDGIVYTVYKPNLTINLQVAKELVKERIKVSDGITRPFFVDISNLVSVDLAAREYLSGEEASKLISAGAIYSSNPLAKFAGRLFIDVNQPNLLTKFFSDKEEALKWLEAYKEKKTSNN